MRSRTAIGAGVALCAALVSCSTIFPHIEQAILPEGATLEELGIALIADGEMWISRLAGWIAYLFGG